MVVFIVVVVLVVVEALLYLLVSLVGGEGACEELVSAGADNVLIVMTYL